MRVLVCGGRAYSDRKTLYDCLDALRRSMGTPMFLIVGYNPKSRKFQGADQLAFEWAKDRGVPGACYPADWDRYDRAAGPIRNQLMLDKGKPEVGMAFPGHHGTADMMKRMKDAEIRVIEVMEAT